MPLAEMTGCNIPIYLHGDMVSEDRCPLPTFIAQEAAAKTTESAAS